MTTRKLLLRWIAEVEAEAQAVRPGPWSSVLETGSDAEDFGAIYGPDGWDDYIADWHGTATGDFIARHDPVHVLAECAAHRQLVEEYGHDQRILEILRTIYEDVSVALS